MKILNLLICFIFIVAFVSPSCTNKSKCTLHRTGFKGNALGTFYSIYFYHSDTSAIFVQSLKYSVDSLLADFNSVLSIYDTVSVISKINNNRETELHPLFIDVFKKSDEISRLSSGAFDITVAPLVNAWGFGSTDKAHITQQLIDSLLQFVGYEKVRIENGKLLKDNPGIMLDMNAVAKGYAVDVVSLFLESKGIESYIVEIGGEVRAGKAKPDGSLWVIAIEKPAISADAPQQEEKRIFLEKKSVATSGNYRRYFKKDGIKYSHTIDPSTGYPVKHSLLSATIIAQDCMTADALATACMVLGVEKAIALCESIEGVEGFFIVAQTDGSYLHYSTSGFNKYVD